MNPPSLVARVERAFVYGIELAIVVECLVS